MQYTIDLLRESERRYEGPVSTRFLMYTGTGVVAAALALLVSYVAFNSLMLRGDLGRAERTWQQMEPRYRELLALQETIGQATRLAEEFEGWSRSGESWHRILLHLQREIPPSIQIVRLEAKDEIERVGRPRRGEPMPDPVRRAQIYLTGRVVGPSGEEEVTRLVQALQSPSDAQAPRFRTASLVSIQRDRRAAPRTENVFELDLSGYPREIK